MPSPSLRLSQRCATSPSRLSTAPRSEDRRCDIQAVTSARNPGIKLAKRLARARARAESGLVLLEGRRLVAAAIDAGVGIEALYVTDPTDTLAHGVRHASVVDAALLAEMATTQHPQGVVAVAHWWPSARLGESSRRVLVLCGVSDPGNAGTLIRSAAAFGWDAVVSTTGSCDPTNPKVLRASAGAVFSTEVVAGADPEAVLQMCRDRDLTCVAASTRGGGSPVAAESIALWLGSEAHGLGPDLEASMDASVSIPIATSVESLNVASAGAVLLWELRGGTGDTDTAAPTP